MSTLMSIRASAVPRVINCGPSVHSTIDEMKIEPVNESAQTGTAAHEMLQYYVEGLSDPEVMIPEVANKHQVKESDLRVAYYSGIQGLKYIIANFYPITDPQCEMSIKWTFDQIHLTGHPDLYWLIEYKDEYRILAIVDYKLRNIEGKMPQLKAYGAILVNMLEEQGVRVDRVDTFLISLLDGDCSADSFEPEYLAETFPEELHRALLSRTYRPGFDQCAYCPRKFECNAYSKWLSHELNAFAETDFNEIDTIIAMGEFPKAWERIGKVSGIAYSAREKVKAYLNDNDQIEADGFKYFLGQRSSGKDILLTDSDAFERAVQLVGNQGLLEAVGCASLKSIQDIAVKRLKEQHGGKPPRGSVGKLRNEVDDILDPVAIKKYSEMVKKEKIEEKGKDNGK